MSLMWPIIHGYLWTSSAHKVYAVFQLHWAMLWSKRNQSMFLYVIFMYGIFQMVFIPPLLSVRYFRYLGLILVVNQLSQTYIITMRVNN